MSSLVKIFCLCVALLFVNVSFAATETSLKLTGKTLKKLYFSCGEVEVHFYSNATPLARISDKKDTKSFYTEYDPEEKSIKFKHFGEKCAVKYSVDLEFGQDMEIALGAGSLVVNGITQSKYYKSFDGEVTVGSISAAIPVERGSLAFNDNHVSLVGNGTAKIILKVGNGTLTLM